MLFVVQEISLIYYHNLLLKSFVAVVVAVDVVYSLLGPFAENIITPLSPCLFFQEPLIGTLDPVG